MQHSASRRNSPAAAAEVMQKLKARFGQVAPVHMGEEAFQATDQYLGRLCILRKNRLIAGWAVSAGDVDPAAVATKLASRLP